MTPIGLYLHVPFCSRRCGYCAFHATASWRPGALERIVDTMLADLDAVGALVPPAETIYVGGGTPTVLPADRLAGLIVRARGNGAPVGEITVEANPESATATMLDALAGAGVTRLSVGVQTLEPEAAAALDRRLTSVGEIETIRNRWSGSLGADLIHGAPRSTVSGTLKTIDALVGLGVDHLSVYSLSIEEGTPLARAAAHGSIDVPDSGSGWRRVVAAIERRGLRRYEVSNFAKPGRECRHNERYWRGEDYLGIGPSAVSTLGDSAFAAAIGGLSRPYAATRPRSFARRSVRLTQPADHARYLRRRHAFDVAREELGPSELLAEYVMLGLRTASGISLEPVREVIGTDAWDRFAAGLERSRADGLLALDGARARPTGVGMDLLDRVLERLVPELLADLESAHY
ncbi:MAG: coproporphyrinogen-III oxidase family protein [Spirochaetota bacterium]